MFDNWCEIDESGPGGRKKLCRVTERPTGRAAIRDELTERVRSHYDKLEQIADDIERLGFPGASAILRERMPQTPRERSGELGEIIATEFFEFHTDFRIPVRRLQYKDGREMALRGDDFLGVAENKPKQLRYLKGEAKSGKAVSSGVVTDAREKLSAHDGRPTPISLLFVADRLLEAADGDDQSLGRRVRDDVALKDVEPKRITHGLFALSGNRTDKALKADLNAADGVHDHVSVGFRIDGHQSFIAEIYEEAGKLGDH